MKNYLDIIANEDKLLDMYEIMKVDDNSYIIPDVENNTDNVDCDDETIELKSVSLSNLIVTTNDLIRVWIYDYNDTINEQEPQYVLRLDNIDNHSFGYITVSTTSCYADSGRYIILTSIALIYKNIRNVTFKFNLIYDRNETLAYIKKVDDL